jgi:hypothetical protein
VPAEAFASSSRDREIPEANSRITDERFDPIVGAYAIAFRAARHFQERDPG